MDVNILHSKRNKINNPWITNGIIASINRKDYLFKLWRKSVKTLRNKDGDHVLYNNYKEYRKKLNVIINCAKKDYRLKQFKKSKAMVSKLGN